MSRRSHREHSRCDGQQDGSIGLQSFKVREGCEVRMVAVERHNNATLPSLAPWARQLRVYRWGRRVTQVKSVD